MAGSVEALLPHTDSMRLLAEVVHHESERTVCRVDPLASGLFEERPGRLPSWLALEYMAQCAGAHGALTLPTGGAGGAPGGLLLGARGLELRVPSLELRPMEVEARFRGAARGLVSFECSLRDPERETLLATGRLSVYTLPDG